MKTYKPLRDNVVVEVVKLETTKGGVYLPDRQSSRWIKVRVLAIGPSVTEEITEGDVVLAEDMTEKMEGTNLRVILSKYLHVIEGEVDES